MTWANTLVVGGVGGWRLPNIVDTGASGCDWSYAGGTTVATTWILPAARWRTSTT